MLGDKGSSEYLHYSIVLFPLSSPLFISVSPVSLQTEQLHNYSSLVSSRFYFPIIIYLSQIPSCHSQLLLSSCLCLGMKQCMASISKLSPLSVSQQITNESCHSFMLSLHMFGQSSEHHPMKSVPIKFGTVCCRHFLLAHSPFIPVLWGLIFLNSRGWQPTTCIFQKIFLNSVQAWDLGSAK